MAIFEGIGSESSTILALLLLFFKKKSWWGLDIKLVFTPSKIES